MFQKTEKYKRVDWKSFSAYEDFSRRNLQRFANDKNVSYYLLALACSRQAKQIFLWFPWDGRTLISFSFHKGHKNTLNRDFLFSDIIDFFSPQELSKSNGDIFLIASIDSRVNLWSLDWVSQIFSYIFWSRTKFLWS